MSDDIPKTLTAAEGDPSGLLGQCPKTIPVRDRTHDFEILQEIGAGGMGKVYRARDPVSGDLLALKVLASGADITRFSLESNVLAKLHHPSIVAYRDHGVTRDGSPFLAMEWIDGDDLERELEHGRFSVAETLRIARAIADALVAAHAAGIIHRDLKPSNVILTRLGREVKLVDFGIARSEDVHGLTQTGQAVGTPGYMSPEQARGMVVDARSDLFSLGCLLFRCLGGQRPFGGSDIMQYATSLALEEPPRLGSLVPRVPPALEALVSKLLEKDASARPADAAHVRDSLDAIIDALGHAADPTAQMDVSSTPLVAPRVAKTLTAVIDPPRAASEAATQRSSTKRSPWPWLVLGLAGLAAGTFTVFRLWGETQAAAPLPAATPSAPDAASAPAAGPIVGPAERAALDRACHQWSTAIAHAQRPDGSFAGEARGNPSGWDTGQQLFALAEAKHACDGVGIATLSSGVRALERLRVPGGLVGPNNTAPPAARRGEAPANAWALLALDTMTRDAADPETTSARARFRTDLLLAKNDDGSFRLTAAKKSGGTGYTTALSAWALVEVGASEAGAAIDWLDRAVLAGTESTKEAGFGEELLWVLVRANRSGRDDAAIRVLAADAIARCRLDSSGNCTRAAYDTGRAPVDVDAGPGMGLVTLWHPWATLAATKLAKDERLDEGTRRGLGQLARWGIGELVRSTDLLGAAPEYKLAEYLVVVSELLR